MNVENNKFLNKEKSVEESMQDNIVGNTLEHNFSKEKSILFLGAVLIIAVIIISYAKDNFLSNYFKTNNDLSSNTIESGGYLETYDPIKNAN